VVGLSCAVLSGCLWLGPWIAQGTTDHLSHSGAKDHYDKAVEALRGGDLALAASHLERFCTTHTISVATHESLAVQWSALFRLAELYVHTERPVAALRTLAKAAALHSLPDEGGEAAGWASPLADYDGSQHASLERWVRIAENAATQLESSPASVDLLAMYRDTVAESSPAALKQLPQWRGHGERIAYEVGRRLEDLQRFEEAIESYSRLVAEASLLGVAQPARALDDIHQWQKAHLRVCLKLAHHAGDDDQRQRVERVLAELAGQAWLSGEELQVVRLARVEHLVALGRMAEGIAELETLQHQAMSEARRTTDGIASLESHANALGNLALRRSELLLSMGDKEEALQVARVAVDELASYELNYELHYLIGRLLISRAEFAAARDHLAKVGSFPQATPDALGRAGWLIGETYFLQRNYSAAIDTYRSLGSLGGESPWYARGMIQMAKCHELLGQPAEAYQAYKRFVRDCQALNDLSAEREFATARLDEIQRTQQESGGRSSRELMPLRTK
jgi:tetratricopeptide (TPR) repeat protein